MILIAGVTAGLALLAVLIAGETVNVRRSVLTRPDPRWIRAAIVLAVVSAALILPRLLDLLI